MFTVTAVRQAVGPGRLESRWTQCMYVMVPSYLPLAIRSWAFQGSRRDQGRPQGHGVAAQPVGFRTHDDDEREEPGRAGQAFCCQMSTRSREGQAWEGHLPWLLEKVCSVTARHSRPEGGSTDDLVAWIPHLRSHQGRESF